ncbi:transglutaminase family protein [Lentzea sp. NBRC 102530]|uniref:transglutaminase-like domain-containing protein n=1 Tax=Lentzea sp. NBRC 102530 TaxID=3032201 RepID=UPI0024A2D08C|nr:transglutaminase family protein [Lentzea sp. NBRC 102530]GLY49891.1 transglutaminase [Lentzea sp. NBRC 102530]
MNSRHNGREAQPARGTRLLRVGCAFTYRAEVPTPAVFMVRPDRRDQVRLSGENLFTEPDVLVRDHVDVYGNWSSRLVLPPGLSTVNYAAWVDVPDRVEDVDETAPERWPDDLPGEVLLYTLPSRYCVSDVLADEAWSRFGAHPPGYRRVQAICRHVHESLEFGYGTSTALSTAADVNASGLGVCRDFTHLAISFCRALNIPARYVFGYLPDLDVSPDGAPMDFAAWMEVWLGDRWWTFDPRNSVQRKGRVVVGRGRDAADVAMVTTFGGPVLESMVVQAEEDMAPAWR